jgi:hypothetical protein
MTVKRSLTNKTKTNKSQAQYREMVLNSSMDRRMHDRYLIFFMTVVAQWLERQAQRSDDP